MSRPIQIAVAAALAVSAPAQARPPLAANWPLLAFDRQGACELTIHSNGKIMWIAASGLVPGTRAAFNLGNGPMKPIAWNVLADSAGVWSTPYVPMLWRVNTGSARPGSGGTVVVRIEAAGCDLAASAPWSREVRVIP